MEVAGIPLVARSVQTLIFAHHIQDVHLESIVFKNQKARDEHPALFLYTL